LPNPDPYGGTSCIFLRKDFKCALQVAAEESGQHRWRFKPFYCVVHPLEIKDGRITLDDPAEMVERPASCLRKRDQTIHLMELFRQEIDYLSGNKSNNS